MSAQDFQKCLSWVLLREGGYVDNPKDPGGSTNFGITQTTLDYWQHIHKAAPMSVRSLTPPTVAPIYEFLYWEPSFASATVYPMSLALFDTYVQFSPQTFKAFAVQALGDGYIPAILSKMSESLLRNAAIRIAIERIDFREAYVKKYPQEEIFLEGWLNRDNALKEAAYNS